MTPEHNLSINPNEIQVPIQLMLRDGQNFIDQAPFNTILKDIHSFQDYVVPDITPEGIALCVYHFMNESDFSATYGSGGGNQKEMKQYLKQWKSGIAMVAMDVKKHLLRFPGLEEYTRIYWFNGTRRYSDDGILTYRQNNAPPKTFAMYQHELLREEDPILKGELIRATEVNENRRNLDIVARKTSVPITWTIIRET